MKQYQNIQLSSLQDFSKELKKINDFKDNIKKSKIQHNNNNNNNTNNKSKSISILKTRPKLVRCFSAKTINTNISNKNIQSICIGKLEEKLISCSCSKMPLCNTFLCSCRKNGLKCNFKCHLNSICIWKH
jgi:hypothetical protein